MGHLETIRNVLAGTFPLCDDCLTELTHINPRQTINRYCRENADQIDRSPEKEDCVRCHQRKIVNSLR